MPPSRPYSSATPCSCPLLPARPMAEGTLQVPTPVRRSPRRRAVSQDPAAGNGSRMHQRHKNSCGETKGVKRGAWERPGRSSTRPFPMTGEPGPQESPELGLWWGSWPNHRSLPPSFSKLAFAGPLWPLPIVIDGFLIVLFPLRLFSSFNLMKFLGKRRPIGKFSKPPSLSIFLSMGGKDAQQH